MFVVGERDVGEVELSFALDPDLMRAVHHDLGDAVVVEEILDRSVADDLEENGILQAQAVGAVDGDALVVQRGRKVIGHHGAHLFGARSLDVAAEQRCNASMDAVDELDFRIVAESAELENVRAPVGFGCHGRRDLFDRHQVWPLESGDRGSEDGHVSSSPRSVAEPG